MTTVVYRVWGYTAHGRLGRLGHLSYLVRKGNEEGRSLALDLAAPSAMASPVTMRRFVALSHRAEEVI